MELTTEQRLIAEIDLIESIEYREENVCACDQFNTWETILEQKKKQLEEIQNGNK